MFASSVAPTNQSSRVPHPFFANWSASRPLTSKKWYATWFAPSQKGMNWRIREVRTKSVRADSTSHNLPVHFFELNPLIREVALSLFQRSLILPCRPYPSTKRRAPVNASPDLRTSRPCLVSQRSASSNESDHC